MKPGDRVQSARAPIVEAPEQSSRFVVNRQRNQNAAHLEVVSIEAVEALAAKVYNLEVAGHHTYAVGELQAWAHNANDGRPPAVPPDWVPNHNSKKGTLRWYCPCNPKGNWVRYNIKGKYYKIFLDGCARDKDGNKVPDDSPDAHIPEGDLPPELPTPK